MQRASNIPQENGALAWRHMMENVAPYDEVKGSGSFARDIMDRCSPELDS
jgi:hypothetical protein